LPLTLGSVRDQLRKGHFNGDLFEAAQFLLDQYDSLWEKYKDLAPGIREFTVERDNGQEKD